MTAHGSGSPEESARARAAHRAALDHVLGLVAEAPWSESLVLRGSMAMLAWVGDDAREPADLDFVVLPQAGIPIDPLHPYPYVPRIEVVQQWPEAAAGAARYEIWRDAEDEFATRGARPVVPPDGLRWDMEPDLTDLLPPHDDLLAAVRRQPEAARGVRLDADQARRDADWGYAYGDDGTGGVRLLVPWHAEGLPSGAVQIDMALDEVLPQAPVWMLVPRADDGSPSVVRTASRELSLAWKLQWLRADGAAGGTPQCKDLYDAVLLAETKTEAKTMTLSPRLIRRTLPPTAIPGKDDFCLHSVHRLEADWAAFRAEHIRVRGSAEEWFRRLVTAVAAVSSGSLDGLFACACAAD